MSQFELQSGAPGIPATPGTIVARIGTSSAGTAGDVLQFVGGQQTAAETSLGDGRLVAAIKRHLSLIGTECIGVKADASIDGILGAVVQSGTGPAVTAALIDVGVGPHYDLPDFKIEITTGGAPGVAQATVHYDGASGGTTFTIEDEGPAVLRGSADLSLIDPTTLNGTTFDLSDVDGVDAIVLNFGGIVTLQDVVDQVDSIGGIGYAKIVGGKYLQFAGVVKGSAGGSLEVAAGTANAILGFTVGQSSVGTDSTFDIPHTGVRLTFTAPGTYVLGETYSIPMTAPRASVTDITDAMDALRASDLQFGVIHIRQPALDGLDLRTLAAAVSLKIASWRSAEENPRQCFVLLESPLGDPSDYSINDADVKAEMAGQTRDHYIGVAHGDIFLSFEDLPGLHRESSGIPRAERYGFDRLSRSAADGGRGALPSASLKGADGTACRTEGTATIKMEADGFSVVKNEDGLTYFKNDRTRAVNGSQLETAGVLRAGNEAIRVIRLRSREYENSDPPKGADGQLANPEPYRAQYDEDLNTLLVKPGHCSAARVTSIALMPDGGQDRLVVNFEMLRKAQIKAVSGTVTVVGESTLEG